MSETADEKLLREAKPFWMQPEDPSLLRVEPFQTSPDYVMAPLLQKKPPILSTASVNETPGGGKLDANTADFVIISNGLFGIASVFTDSLRRLE